MSAAEDSPVNVENVESVVVSPAMAPAAQPKPGSGLAAIMSPDSAIRAHPAYQIINRLWRPAGGWGCVVGMAYGFVIGPAILRPLGIQEWLALTAIVGGLWSLKSLEKRDGVA